MNVFTYFMVIKVWFKWKTNAREDFRKYLQGNFKNILPQGLRTKKAEKMQGIVDFITLFLFKGLEKMNAIQEYWIYNT